MDMQSLKPSLLENNMDLVTGGEAVEKILNGEWESAHNIKTGESLILNTRYTPENIGNSYHPFVILVDSIGTYIQMEVLDKSFISPHWEGKVYTTPFTLIPRLQFPHLFDSGNNGYEFKYDPESPDIYRIKAEWSASRQQKELTVRKMTAGGIILQKVKTCVFRVPWRKAEIRLDNAPPLP